MLKIATWNVNSINVRLNDVLNWITQYEPDLLALQETKVEDANFPADAFLDLGYNVIRHGQKTYNGVAIISKNACQNIQYNIPDLDDNQRRMIAADIGDLRIINVYIPNGSSLDSDKFIYKNQWLTALSSYIKTQLKTNKKIIILGDFNIAPQDLDVHNPKLWQGSVLVSPEERSFFMNWLELGFYDTLRLKYPTEQMFSWWDYRAGAFKKNHGLRIDHILITEALKNKCHDLIIDKNTRANARPSDHAPVLLLLDH